ncbi:hypothetical protein RIR_e7628_A0A2I1E2K1_9GLOM [Rhizophagus irregularis DAOM 181602=DAOM 197198]|nr:hypothetical protein RhiirB3_35291 [Rhizophagus irregularis]GET64164.1 hypothetical protein RIR_e7628_A0A2I1E2K1_9GLOM [Rhizophagus irregularis DAOM 181602=DAOM 197198]
MEHPTSDCPYYVFLLFYRQFPLNASTVIPLHPYLLLLIHVGDLQKDSKLVAHTSQL